jgi:formate hydrogenlyase subunit 3/multisubunit Na+/H+ antiporter MnhD subunit
LELIETLLLFVVAASLIHMSRSWPRVAFGIILLSTGALLVDLLQVSNQSLDILSVSLAIEPAPRDFLVVAVVLTGTLALATITKKDRVSLGFLYWSWVPWFIALTVGDFVVAVFAWAMGFVVQVFGMKPRRFQRASGAAYFLVVNVIATASLLLANRFVALYPLTPERTFLIQFAVFFLALGFGIAFALVPFQFWIGPMTDDAPLPTTAAILALGQPIGLFLLIGFLNQNLWLVEKSNLFEVMTLAGLATSVVGGLMAAVERRAGRLLGYAAVFTFGFTLLDLGRASQEGIAYAGLEVLSRAVALTLLACAATVGNEVESVAVRRTAHAAAILAGFSLVGLRLGVGLSERWNALLQIAGSDQRIFALLILAHMGLLVGVIRFTSRWPKAEPAARQGMVEIGVTVKTEPVSQPLAGSVLNREFGTRSATAMMTPGNGGRSIEKQAAAGQISQEQDSPEIPTVAVSGGNGTGEEVNGSDSAEVTTDEYVFEDHLREIVKSLIERARPHLRDAARSLPRGTMGVVILIWSTWRIWMTMALLLAIVCALLIVGLVPGALFDRAVASLGHPPLVH